VRRIHNGLLALTATFAFALAGVACDNTRDGARQDTAEMNEEAREEAAEARAEGREATDDARRTANEGGSAIGAAGETLDIKMALIDADDIDADEINVDTNHETRTVVLKGTVPTEAMKNAAERVAQREAEGYRVNNQLTVRPN
jgi:osmotically-inducible protein OsmY